MTVDIKVLIIDDEQLVRAGLKSTVDWSKFEMQVVADAPNGTKGWEAFLKFQPEVVITDIVMPEMDGLQLTQKIKDYNKETKVLLLSCHRDFDYAQAGIKLGASGYLLKTKFTDEEMEAYLSEFQVEIRQSQVQSRESDNGLDKRNASLQAWLLGLNEHFKAMLECWMMKDWEWMQSPTYVYHINHYDIDLTELVGKLHRPYEIIPLGEERCFVFCRELDKPLIDSAMIRMKSKVPRMTWNLEGPIAGIEPWLETVRRMFIFAEIEKKYKIEQNQWSAPILKSILIIEDNLHLPLSVTEISHKVGFSRSHFSTVFKKATGESFIEF
ncbi:MAG TPA: response regulator, partial [Bacilli bacterium]